MAGERLEKTLQSYRREYRKADRERRSGLLDEFCSMTGYHRKYAINLLNRRGEGATEKPGRRRRVTYSDQSIRILEVIWKASGHPWSVRLKALLPLWLPWARKRFAALTPEVERELVSISARQIDRRLKEKKRELKRRWYGRTKPGSLLRHQIPVKTDSWDVDEPGFTEIDLVAHCGPSASGEFGHTLNLTDIYTGWVESRQVLGKSEAVVCGALEEIRRCLPFTLKGIDSDNGSEFINHHLFGYCGKHHLQFTRGRPYKKDDNAHIEQKNWTHVRKLFGWERYDTPEVLEAMNGLCREDLSRMMNLFQPSVKLTEKCRIGSRLTRRYDAPQTPLDRLVASYANRPLPPRVKRLQVLRQHLDPFELSERIETTLTRIERLRHVSRHENIEYYNHDTAPLGELPRKTAHASL